MTEKHLRAYDKDLALFPHSWGGKLRLCAAALVNYFRNQNQHRWHAITIGELVVCQGNDDG